MSQPINLSDCILLLNEQVAVLEKILEHHSKAHALLETALSGDFLQKPKLIIHDFLWALSDLIKQIKQLNEELIDALFKAIDMIKAA